MKKSYLTPSINVVEYTLVDIVTASFFDTDGKAGVLKDWIDADWLK